MPNIKTPFPGDTAVNGDSRFEWDDSGVQWSPPGARGEVRPRFPGSKSMPVLPQSSVSSDDSRRKEEIPPMYNNARRTASSVDDLPAFVAALRDQYKVELDVRYVRDHRDRPLLDVEWLYVPPKERKNGKGSAVMNALAKWADEHGATLTLSIADRNRDTGTTSRNRLKKFYRQFGFKPNHGRSKDYSLSMYTDMVRHPREASGGSCDCECQRCDQGYHCGNGSCHYFQKSAFGVTRRNTPREQESSKLVRQMPKDINSEFAKLSEEIRKFVDELDLQQLDLYDYKHTPPREWVEEAREAAEIDWDDLPTWRGFMKKVKHADALNWMDLDNVPAMAPTLHQRFLEAGEKDFKTWFTREKPDLHDDEALLTHAQVRGRGEPESDLGKAYAKYWRQRNLGKTYGDAYKRAKERWYQHIRENYHEFVPQQYLKPFQTVMSAKDPDEKKQPAVVDVITSLADLPLIPEWKTKAQYFKRRLDDLTHRGISALDIRAEDLMYGKREVLGSAAIPIKQITLTSNSIMSSNQPVVLYKYAGQYYPATPYDAAVVNGHKDKQALAVAADVIAVTPGSSHDADAVTTSYKALAACIQAIEGGMEPQRVLVGDRARFTPMVAKYFEIMAEDRNEQTADNAGASTFNCGTGGVEPGYGTGTLSPTYQKKLDKQVNRRPIIFDHQAQKKRASMDAVPAYIFRLWEKAHEFVEKLYWADDDTHTEDAFHYVRKFVESAKDVSPEDKHREIDEFLYRIDRLHNMRLTDNFKMALALDSYESSVHSIICEVTGSERAEWYKKPKINDPTMPRSWFLDDLWKNREYKRV